MNISPTLDHKTIAELKGLVMDATRKANSGHPGGAMSSADFAVILYKEYLRFAPKHPKWHNRDRFVLSAGHESMLLYSLLHFMDLLSLDEIKNFRQLGSLTPGHPENHLTPGVEATTGPLGQGISMAVGMAIAQKHQEIKVGKWFSNNKVYCLCGDGDLQEPIAIGAATLAGHYALSNLVVFYDKNDIQISGKTQRSDSTNFNQLFDSLQWETIEIDGNDHNAIRKALDYAQQERSKPLIIIGNTIIAKGTFSMEGSHKTHGEPLKVDEIAQTKLKLGLNAEAFFAVSDEVKTYFTQNLNTFNAQAETYQVEIEKALATNSDFAIYYKTAFGHEMPEIDYPNLEEDMASRQAFGKVLDTWAVALPQVMGGSADLEPSNNTAGFAALTHDFTASNYNGRNFAFGVREFPMVALTNGMALYGGVLPFNATFLTFSDYSRNALRMSAIQQLQVLHVFTHDSVFLGEDGPTHQPVEHVMSLRLIPNMLVMRPADAVETLTCMQQYLKETHRPSLLALTRQKLKNLNIAPYASSTLAAKGGYVKFENASSGFDLVVFSSGSEVALSIDVANTIAAKHHKKVRVVSLPCWELFFEQDPSYIQEVMTFDAILRVSIEAGTTLGWQKFTGLNGINIGIDRFGESAPMEDLAVFFGLNTQAIVAKIETAMQ